MKLEAETKSNNIYKKIRDMDLRIQVIPDRSPEMLMYRRGGPFSIGVESD